MWCTMGRFIGVRIQTNIQPLSCILIQIQYFPIFFNFKLAPFPPPPRTTFIFKNKPKISKNSQTLTVANITFSIEGIEARFWRKTENKAFNRNAPPPPRQGHRALLIALETNQRRACFLKDTGGYQELHHVASCRQLCYVNASPICRSKTEICEDRGWSAAVWAMVSLFIGNDDANGHDLGKALCRCGFWRNHETHGKVCF